MELTPAVRARLARVLLAAGVAAVAAAAVRSAPSEQTLVVALRGDRKHVREIRGSLVRDDEEVAGFERRFPQGAPERISYAPRIASGPYRLVVTVVSTAPTSPTTTEHTVELGGNTVRVHVSAP